MKKYFSIAVAVLLAAITLSLTACGDDKEKEPDEITLYSKYIKGSWMLTNVTPYLEADPNYALYQFDDAICSIFRVRDDVGGSAISQENLRHTRTISDRYYFGDKLFRLTTEDKFAEATIIALTSQKMVLTFGDDTRTYTYKKISNEDFMKWLNSQK